jgi:hypothetical protein
LDRIREDTGDRHDTQHHHEVGVFLVVDLRPYKGAKTAEAEQYQQDVATISASRRARPDGENPVVKMETQTANTTSDNVFDMTVAPTVTVTGSEPPRPSRLTTGRPRRVCEASSEPITSPGIAA